MDAGISAPRISRFVERQQMSQVHVQKTDRKPWQPPVLERLSVDLSAIRQKLAAKIDSKAVGQIS
ncbi:MAG: hypothetical protein C0510_05930 [Erythrobacter sp.]|nr:hypothetical protein [Erythrobacter sp.]